MFVGRAPELDQLSVALAFARTGRGRAVLVRGDAGVGKTRLTQHACALADDFLVLAGAGLPMPTLTIPLLPLRAALADLPISRRPPLRGAASEAAEELDRWLELRCAEQPVAVAIDDIHWADPATLDVLMWVLAGLTQRRLVVLMTLRRGEAGPGHPLHRWLADARRLPGFTELSLGSLDLEETREQLAGVLGDEPHDSLVREVFERTGGNAYLNRLLVQGVSATQATLGPDLPDDLASAALRAWHGMSPPARDLARVLAVGGRIARPGDLERSAALAGVSDLQGALRECVDSDLLELDDRGGYWFHHPMQAEALAGRTDPGELRRLHAAMAEAMERELESGDVTAPGGSELETLSLIADHHERAGHTHVAYEWALRAAGLAEATGAVTSLARLLRRAVDMLENRGESTTDEVVDLWSRLRVATAAVADHDGELFAVEALLARHDPERDPLVVAELLVRRQHLRFSTGQSFFNVAELERAVDLSQQQPETWQHALALSELAHATLWQEDPRAPQLARDALDRARECGHPQALSFALTANAMLAVLEERYDEGRRFGCEGVSAAARAREGWAFVHATMWEANSIGSEPESEYSQLLNDRRAEAAGLGMPHRYQAWLAAVEASGRLHAGDWVACQQLLRLALGSTPGALVDASARLTAARLAALQGHTHEAEGHLARADELFAETSTFLAFEFDAVRALVLLSGGHRREAIDAAAAGIATDGVLPTMCEWLLPLAARALADLAQRARDGGADPTEHLAELDALVLRHPHIFVDFFPQTTALEHQLTGLEAIYRAEVVRSRHPGQAHPLWTEASTALHGYLPWDECYALWREAESLLLAGRAHRDAGADALRRARILAARLLAQPLIDELEHLARTARVPLADPASTQLSAGTATATTVDLRLTQREVEVLGHIVAGRTYGEIAKALVLSEKTVSSHVSHLLRKTGSANRIDLARWATRPD